MTSIFCFDSDRYKSEGRRTDAGSSLLLVPGSVIPAQPSSSLMSPGSGTVSIWSAGEFIATVVAATTALVIILILSLVVVTVTVVTRKRHNSDNSEDRLKTTPTMDNPVYESKAGGVCVCS